MATWYMLLPAPPQRHGGPDAARDGRWLPLLVAAEAGFTLVMIVLAPMGAEEAVGVAVWATALAAAATYLKAAVLHAGTLLRLRTPDPQVSHRSALPHLAVLVVLELGVVAVGVLWAQLDASGALHLAAMITVLCTAVCQGQPALLAVGRRMFPPNAPGR